MVRQHERRIPALDGLRGLAILMVMLYHQTVITGPTAIDRAWSFGVMGGWTGVDLFFVLSGFLITGILLDAKGSDGYFFNFYARRFLRIFPLYYAIVAVSFLVLPHLAHAKAANFGRVTGDEAWYWLYLSNILIGIHHAYRHGILDVSWSLAIEEQFYLVWPLVVLMLPRRGLLILCAVVVAGAAAWRVALLGAGADPITTFVLTPGRIDSIVIGAGVATGSRSAPGLALLRRLAPSLGLAAAAGLLLIGLAEGGFDPYSPRLQTIGYSLIGVMFGCLLIVGALGCPDAPLARVLRGRVLRVFGKYSYALYLFHLPLRALIRDTVFGPDRFPTIAGSPLPGLVVFYIVSTGLTLGAAWLSWNVFEKHFLRLKRYFVSRSRPAPEGRLALSSEGIPR